MVGKLHDWSYSDSCSFQECPKAFNLSSTRRRGASKDYLGSVTYGSLTGLAVHNSIQQEIDAWSHGRRIDVLRAERAGEAFVREVWSNAQSRILDVKNGVPLSSLSLEKVVFLTRLRIRDFVHLVWPRFRGHSYILHETTKSFGVGDVRVWVRVDLCTRDVDGRLVLTDWKTGTIGPQDVNGMQTGVYSLWAVESLHESPENILSQLVSLRTCEFQQRWVSLDDLSRVRARILEEVHDWEQRLEKNDYPASPSPPRCLSCAFLRLCQEGQSALASETSLETVGYST